jgi:hypothetical protein
MKLNNQTKTKNIGEKNMSNFDDLLNTNTTKKETPKASKKSAEIVGVPENIQTEIDSLLNAKKAKKTAESDIKKAEPTIIEHGIKMKDDKAFGGKFQKSYKLGNAENHVNMVTANKWSFKEDDVDEIKKIIDGGCGNPDDLIIEDKIVKLKAEVFSNPDLQKKFIKMVKGDFPEFFETVVSHHVSADFDEKVYDLGEGAFEDIKLLMKQSKPSLR